MKNERYDSTSSESTCWMTKPHPNKHPFASMPQKQTLLPWVDTQDLGFWDFQESLVPSKIQKGYIAAG